MANINDYKILHKSCINIFKDVNRYVTFVPNKFDQLSDEAKARYGFYYFVLQNIVGVDDYNNIDSVICDSEYNATLHNEKFDDCGIDSIYIDEDNKRINFFNFKYRNSFDADKRQKITEILDSSRFFNLIKNSTSGLEKKMKELTSNVHECLYGNDVWDIYLYVVSNENHSVDIGSRDINNMAKEHGVKIKSYGLDDLIKFLSLKPAPINATLKLSKDAVMSYSKGRLSTDISFIFRINLAELIRITCDDEFCREEYNIENESKLSDVKLEYSVLFDNVRGFIVSSKYNRGILKTLKEDESNFFLYNNGLTVVADDIISTDVNGKTAVKIEIKGFQVLNGGQTLRSVHKFNQEDSTNITNILSNAEVLVRLLKIKDDSLKGKIGEYTNSQNSIDYLDLKSLSKEQQDLEIYLAGSNIKYTRKKWNLGDIIDDRDYSYIISMQRMGQILLAVKKGLPQEVSNKKKDIFGKYYDELFLNDDLLSSKTVELIHSFYNIQNQYKNSKYTMSDQKVLYVLYMQTIKPDVLPINLIDKLEKLISDYTNELKESGVIIGASRILIMAKFRDYLAGKLSE